MGPTNKKVPNHNIIPPLINQDKKPRKVNVSITRSKITLLITLFTCYVHPQTTFPHRERSPTENVLPQSTFTHRERSPTENVTFTHKEHYVHPQRTLYLLRTTTENSLLITFILRELCTCYVHPPRTLKEERKTIQNKASRVKSAITNTMTSPVTFTNVIYHVFLIFREFISREHLFMYI